MKRSSPSYRSREGRASRGPLARVLDSSPVVYLGPDALGAFVKGRGLLLGAQRPGWVDALSYEPFPGTSWRQVLKARFNDGYDWDVVGIVLPHRELERRTDVLVRELVPGDIVLGLGEGSSPAHAYVNLGDRIAPARLKVTRSRRGSTSARPRHQYR